MANPESLVWLITGCSSGIGQALANVALEKGARVIASGRSAATKLAQFEGTGAKILDLDVSSSEVEIRKQVAEAAKIYGRIDVLVNNAGITGWGAIEEAHPGLFQEIFDINVHGVQKVTRAVLPYMRTQKSGTIINVGSMYGEYAPPAVSAYASSKFALEGWTESLSQEVAPFNIRCSVIKPGFFRSQIFQNSVMATPEPKFPPTLIDEYIPLNQFGEQIVSSMTGASRGDTRKLAILVVDAVHGEGYTKEKGLTLPLRLPIGPDAILVAKRRIKQMQEVVDQWEDASNATDLDGWKAIVVDEIGVEPGTIEV